MKLEAGKVDRERQRTQKLPPKWDLRGGVAEREHEREGGGHAQKRGRGRA